MLRSKSNISRFRRLCEIDVTAVELSSFLLAPNHTFAYEEIIDMLLSANIISDNVKAVNPCMERHAC